MFKKYLILLLFIFIFHNSVYSAPNDFSHMLGIKQNDFKTGFIAVKKAKKYLKKKKIKKIKKKLKKKKKN